MSKPIWSLYTRLICRIYKNIDRFEVNINNIKVFFSTKDSYSKLWFFPRYDGGRIHEKPVTDLLLETLSASKCFVDVGAHLGWYTCLAGKHMPDGIVYGFEMDDLNYSLLQNNVKINGCHNIKTYHIAVTDTSGRASYIRNSKIPSPTFKLSPTVQDKKSGEVISIEAITLDDFFKDKEVLPDVVKIDVEGAETKVLRGMKTIMNNGMAKLFVEIHPDVLPVFNSSAEEVVSLLIVNGYEVFEIQQMRRFDVRKPLKKLDNRPKLRGNTMLYAYKIN